MEIRILLCKCQLGSQSGPDSKMLRMKECCVLLLFEFASEGLTFMKKSEKILKMNHLEFILYAIYFHFHLNKLGSLIRLTRLVFGNVTGFEDSQNSTNLKYR